MTVPVTCHGHKKLDSNFYLDSTTALNRVRRGINKPESNITLIEPVNNDTGFVTQKESRSLFQSQSNSNQPSLQSTQPDTGFVTMGELNRMRLGLPQSQPEVAAPPPKKEDQSFLGGLYEAVKGGAQQTAGSVESTFDVLTGNNQSIVENANEAKKREQESKAQALKELKKSLADIKEAPKDASLLGEAAYYTKKVAGAMWDNLEGAGQFIAEQAPNAAVALGAGWAGAQAGAIAGTFFGGPVGTTVGGIGGFFVGMFGGNALLEIGGKAQEKAADGQLTDAERKEALKEGSVKAGVITGVDVATLGATKWILGTSSRALEKATIKALEGQGINAEKAALNIKRAQDEAVAASKGLDSAAAKANFEQATINAVSAEGLTNPAVVKAVQDAQRAAYQATTKLSKRAGRGAAVFGLETLGEGVGEYLGELAATGDSKVLDAVIEALAGATQSVTEIYQSAKVEDAKTLTRATAGLNAEAPETTEDKQQSSLKQAIEAVPAELKTATTNIDKQLQTEKGTALLAKLYENNPVDSEERKLLRQAAERAGILSEFELAIRTPETLALGEQIISDYPEFAKNFETTAANYAQTMPSAGKVKRPPPKPKTMEDLDAEAENFENTESYLSSLEAEVARIKAEQEERRNQQKVKNAADQQDAAATETTTPTPSRTYGETMKPLVMEDVLDEKDIQDPLLVDFVNATDKISRSEKISDPKDWTKEEKEAWQKKDWETFSRLRGYTEDEIADYKNFLNIYQEVEKKYGLDHAAGINYSHQIATNRNGLGDTDQMYSKTEEGKVKAVFFKDLKKVFYSNFAWNTGPRRLTFGLNGDTLSRKQFRALELHEVGAHYAMERMLGDKAYQALLKDLAGMRGKDKLVDEAYASVPKDTAPQLVDHEALGYLVENYENMNIVQKFLQMIKDWYAKTFNGKELTSTDLKRMVQSAFNAYESEVQRVYLKDNISASPKAGKVKLDFQSALNSRKDAHEFVDFMEQFKDKVDLSGSLALSAQKAMWRPSDAQVHDLDYRVKDSKDLADVLAAIAQKYPDSGIANKFKSSRTKSDIISIRLDINDNNSLTVDFFTSPDNNWADTRNVSHTYTGVDGQQKTINLTGADAVFDAKMRMGRAKDVNDAIASGSFDTAFSKTEGEKQTSAVNQEKETKTSEQQKRIQRAKDESALLAVSDPTLSNLIGSGDGKSRFERTIAKATSGDDAAADAADRFVAAGRARREAKQALDDLNVEQARAKVKTPGLTAKIDKATQTYTAADKAFQEASSALEATEDAKPLPQAYEQRGDLLKPNEPLTIEQLKAEREAQFEAIKNKILDGQFFEAEKEWSNYSNTMGLLRSRVKLITQRIEDGKIAIEEERGSPTPDEKRIATYEKALKELIKNRSELQNSYADAKNEFKQFLQSYVNQTRDSNLIRLVEKYVTAPEQTKASYKTFLSKYTGISFYRNAINQLIKNAYESGNDINLKSRPDSIFENLSPKQVGFLKSLLDQTKLTDVKSLFNDYKERRDAAEAKRAASGLSVEGQALQRKLDGIVNQLYEQDTYKNLITEYRNQLEMIYRAVNGNPEPGDIDFYAIAEGSQALNNQELSKDFDPSIGKEIKADTKQVLLDMAKSIESDIRDALDNRVESLATRFNMASDLIANRLLSAKADAMNAGMSMREINRVYDDAMRTLIVGIGYKTAERKERIVTGETKTKRGITKEARYAPTLEQLFGRDIPTWAKESKEQNVPQAVQDLIENTPLEASASLDGLVADIQSGAITVQNALKEIRLSIQDGDFSMQDVKDAFARAKKELPAEFYGVFSNIATKYSLEYWVKKNGGGYAAKDQWLTSYHNTVTRFGDNAAYKDVLELTPVEKAEYEAWLKDVREMKSRRNSTDINETTDTAVLNKFLFSKYSLAELKDPSLLSEKDQVTLGKIGFNQLVKEWHRDIEYAIRQYPNLKDAILSFDPNSDARVKGEDALDHAEWMQEVNRRVSDSIARSKETEVRGLLGALHEIGGITGNQYEEFYAALTIADMNEAKAIADNAIELSKRMVGEASVANVEADFISTVMQLDGVKAVSVDQMVSDEIIDQYETVAGRKAYRSDYVVEEKQDGSELDMDQQSELDGNMLFSDDNYSDDHGSDRLRQGAYSGVVSAANVQTWVAQLVSGWKIHPNIEVLSNPRQLPEPLRSRVLSKLSNNMGAKGYFDGATGNIYLFSDYIVSKADAEFTVFHEAYGHLGMRGFLGAAFDSFLESQYKTNLSIKRLADQKIANGMGKLEAIEEVLADAATENIAPGAVKTYLGKVINGLRQLGFNNVANWFGYITNAELQYVLKASREWAQGADYKVFDGAPDIVRLSETRLPYEMFAMKGGKLHGYARYNPLTDEWYVFSSMSGDIRDNYVSGVRDNYEDVVEELNRLGKVERRMRSSYYIDDKIPSDFVDIPRISEYGPMKQRLHGAWQYFQNEYLPVFKLVDHLNRFGRLGDFDLKTSLTLYERKTGVMVENFNQQYVTPIMDLLKEASKLGATEEIVNNFLVAQTAAERNAVVVKRNPKNDAGSGMAPRTRTKADGTVIPGYLDVLEQVEKSPYKDQLYQIGKMLDKLGDIKVDYEVKTGLISANEGMLRKLAYRHYRNLSGVNNDLDNDPTNDPSLNVGKKFNLKGRDKRALGRGDIAPDVLARTLLAFEASIVRGQKNLIAQKILALFETNYDPSFISINEQAKVQKIGADGFVQLVDDTNYIGRKDVMVAKVRGIPITMRFKELGSQSVAEALHGMVYPPQATPLMTTIGKFTRFIGQMLTTWNPLWIPVNFVRDVQTMWNNAVVDGRLPPTAANQMVKALAPAAHVALVAGIKDIHVTTKAGKLAKQGLLNLFMMKKPDRKMYQAYLEAKAEGGLTSFVSRKGLEEQIIQIDFAINGARGVDRPLEAMRGWLKFMEIMTIPMEMAPRIAAYSVVRDPRYGNMSKEQAAVFSGDITINFNMRGTAKELRHLYVFFNPAVQGTEKMARLAYNNRGRFAAVAGGWMAFGMLMNLIGRAMSDDDDDGINKYDKLPVYKRGTSIVYNAEQRGGAIPLPYGWNAFYAMGHFGYDSLFANVPWGTTTKRIASTFFEAFAPLGTGITDAKSPESAAAKLVSPTIGVPMVEWMMNENRYGAPIRQTQDFGSLKKPDSESAFRSVSPLSQYAMTRLNRLTGGNKWQPGAVDINPAFIDTMLGGYFPGVVNEGYKAASTYARHAQGIETGRDKEPLFDRFSAYPPENYDAATYRRVKEELGVVMKQLEKLPEGNPVRAELLKKYPGVGGAWEAIKIVDANIRANQSRINALEDQMESQRLEKILTPEKEQQHIDAINQLNKNMKYLYGQATKRFIDAGFRDLVVSGD